MKFIFSLFSFLCFSILANAQTVKGYDTADLAAPVFAPAPDKGKEIIAKPTGSVVYTAVEQDAQFPGGIDNLMEWMSDNLVYPAIAKDNGITGVVYITMIVNKDGSMTDHKITRDIGGGCGQAAIKMLKKMPKWTPGKNNGKAVRTYFTLPVTFSEDK